MRIESIKIRNYKGLKNVTMENIPGLAVLIGANGSGKSTLIDVFSFLKDALKDDVRSALNKRGGFEQVVSRGAENEDIFIELKIRLDFEEEKKERLVIYRLEIAETNRQVFVKSEALRFKRGSYGSPYYFIRFENGKGEAVSETEDVFNPDVDYTTLPREEYKLEKPYSLAIKALGQFAAFDAASQIRNLIEHWTINDFHIEDARSMPDAAVAEHLSPNGDNLAIYAQFLHREYPERFERVVNKMAERVPGVKKVAPQNLGDGRIALYFSDGAFDKPFIARFVSDGTIKMFAYLALLADPNPHPLLCVEEPENQLHPELLAILAEEFAQYAQERVGEGQVFITTHSPDFLDYIPLKSIYWLKKTNGYSEIIRAADDENLVALVNGSEPPGVLWRQGLFGKVIY
ncbi:MAG: AAA family ATPase [Proteobacteria bacterium]|nr:AAA family ATPase [Pseudomonadota bacterium]